MIRMLNGAAVTACLLVAALAGTVDGAERQSSAPLWDDQLPVPSSSELLPLQSVRFHVIKPHEPDVDGGYGFLHGVALAWHNGKLYASWGHNRGRENTAGEEARGRASADGGQTWGPTFDIDTGHKNLAVSHGSFLSFDGKLWAFMGAFRGAREDVHTRVYLLNEKTGQWEFQGTAIREGFWPMEEPRRMEDGNWIMGGLIVGEGNPAAVAVSHRDDFLQWDVEVIRPSASRRVWGESTTLVDGANILNISRDKTKTVALLASSRDFGRNWNLAQPSNLPMAMSKPYAGVLTTGHRYLICTTTADSGNRRSPLTIAIAAPGDAVFSKVYSIRDAEFPQGPGDSHAQARLSYPYAVEHNGSLYVGYSNNGGRKGMNINSAELAIIPIAQFD